jgi:hypothetical protein
MSPRLPTFGKNKGAKVGHTQGTRVWRVGLGLG